MRNVAHPKGFEPLASAFGGPRKAASPSTINHSSGFVRVNGAGIDDQSTDMARTLARFVAKIAEPDENGCWNWTACTGAGGYGSFKLHRGKTVQAHRFTYRLYKGEPGDLLVMHSCDNPLCCNPQHLSLGTHQDNMNDRMRKGRYHTHRDQDFQ